MNLAKNFTSVGGWFAQHLEEDLHGTRAYHGARPDA